MGETWSGCKLTFEAESKGEGCGLAGVVEHSPNVRVQKVGTNQKLQMWERHGVGADLHLRQKARGEDVGCQVWWNTDPRGKVQKVGASQNDVEKGERRVTCGSQCFEQKSWRRACGGWVKWGEHRLTWKVEKVDGMTGQH